MLILGMDYFQEMCRDKFIEWFNESKFAHHGPDDVVAIDAVEVFIVWSCKTLQNYKCIIGTRRAPVIAEYTYNGDTKELYENIYEKISNVCCS